MPCAPSSQCEGGLLTPSNLLSLLRCPLAFLFLIPIPAVRCGAIVAAMITDGLDGFFARKFKDISKFGTILDPLMDKFFAIFALGVLLGESALTPNQLLALMGREAALSLFGLYLLFTGSLIGYRVRSIWSGKLFTGIQLAVIFSLSAGWELPSLLYPSLIALSFIVFFELYWRKRYAR